MIYLASGRIDAALTVLQRAGSNAAEKGQTLTDLGAVYLASAASSRPDPALNLLQALAVTRRAIELEPDLLEARFNEGLILERLSLRQAARIAWKRYLHFDPSSEWADEARVRLSSLSQQQQRNDPPAVARALEISLRGGDLSVAELVGRDPQTVRLFIEEELLGQWGEAVLNGRRKIAKHLLGLGQAAAMALAQQTGDQLAHRTIASIYALSSGEGTLSRIATAHAKTYRALKLMRRDRMAEALVLLHESHREFVTLESPFQGLAALQISVCYFYLHRHEEMLDLLHRLYEQEVEDSLLSLQARNRWLTGLAFVTKGDLGAALLSYTSALEIYEQLGEFGHSGFIRALIGDCFHYLGNDDEAWRHHVKALSTLPLQTDIRRRYSLLWSAAQAAIAQGEIFVAERILDELLAPGAGAATLPGVHSEALCRRAFIRQRLGDATGAFVDLQKARYVVEMVPDYTLRRRIEADLDVLDARLKVEQDPAAAIRSLNKALDGFSEAGYEAETNALLIERATAHLRGGDVDAAELDLVAAVARYQGTRRRESSLDHQARLFRQAQVAIRALITLHLDYRRDLEAAFAWAEFGKGNAVLDELRISEGRHALAGPDPLIPVSVKTIQRSMPLGTVLVEMSVLEDRVLLWGLTRRELVLHQQKVAGRELRELVARHRRELLTADFELPATAMLFDLLIRPVMSLREANGNLVVIPEKPLDGIAFPGLYDRSRGEFLTELLPVSSSPSALGYIRAAETANSPRSVSPLSSILIVAPDTVKGTRRRLPSLAEAAIEAAELAAFYPTAEIETSTSAATLMGRLTAEAFDVVHIATHATDGEPGLPIAGLILGWTEAGSPEANGILGAPGVLAAAPLDLPLVVLAACGTLEVKEGQDLFSIAEAFFATGVKSVLGSHWAIHDRQTRMLMADFHSLLSAGRRPGDAIRQAQIDAIRLRDGNRDRSWAAFQLIGLH